MKRTKKLNIFLSTSGTTAKLASRLKVALEKAGYGVFLYTENIDTGTNWVEVLESRIEKCDKMIALITPEYIKSRYCMDEYRAAYRHDGMFFPVLVKSANLTAFQGSIQHTNVVQAFADNDWEVVIDKIVNDFTASLNPSFFSSITKRASEAAATLFDVVGNAVPLFKKKELGIVIANFVQTNNAEYEVSTRWLSELESKFEGIAKEKGIRFALSNTVVKTEMEAKNLLKKTKATIVVWGYVSGKIHDGEVEIPEGIRVNYTLREKLSAQLLMEETSPQKSAHMKVAIHGREDYENNVLSKQTLGLYARGMADIEYLVFLLLAFTSTDIENTVKWLTKALHGLKIRSLKHAIEMSAGNVLAMRGLGYLVLGQYFQATMDSGQAIIKLGLQHPYNYIVHIIAHTLLHDPLTTVNFDAGDHQMIEYHSWFSTMTNKATHLDVAIETCKRFIAEFPDDSTPHLFMSAILWNIYRVKPPEDETSMTLAINTRATIESLRLGLNHVNQAIELGNTSSLAYYLRGIYYSRLNDLTNDPNFNDQALGALHKATTINKSSAASYYHAGLIYLSMKKYRDAKKAFSQAVATGFKTFEEAFGQDENEAEGVIPLFLTKMLSQQLQGIDPNGSFFDDVYYNLALSHKRLGEYQEAIGHFKLVSGSLKLSALENTANTYVWLNDHAKAIQYFNKALQMNSRSGYSLAGRGFSYYRQGDYLKALADWKKAQSVGYTLEVGIQSLFEKLEKQ